MKRNIWLDGVMGVVIGDALGCPVQFIDRAELAKGPVDDMEGYGTFNMPEGTWTDDSSLTLALLISIREKGIRSTGYAVDTLEAAVWSFITTDDFKACELKAVNLGDDADTVGAIAGGMAGLYYGYDTFPGDCLAVIQRREWIEGLCQMEGAI